MLMSLAAMLTASTSLLPPDMILVMSTGYIYSYIYNIAATPYHYLRKTLHRMFKPFLYGHLVVSSNPWVPRIT
jgi:hypothetical protein